MKQRLKKLAVPIMAHSPIWSWLRMRALKDDPVTVLCYHTLGPDTGGVNGWTAIREADFRAQLAVLQAHYDIVSLDDALEWRGGGKPKVVITFDDGDRGLYRHLLPILRETPVPVTIYVATEQFETGRPFWFDRVVNALQGSGRVSLADQSWSLPGTDDNAHWDALRPVLQALKDVPTVERDALADQVAAQGSAPPEPALGPMSKDELAELAQHPSVTIGSHTHGHELLDQLSLEEARASIERSRDLLREWTGQAVEHFAFPNGNYTPELCDLLKDLGFKSATILTERTAPKHTDPFKIPRISPGRYDTTARIKLKMVGV